MGNRRKDYIVLDKQKIVYGRVPKVANSSIKATLTHLLEGPFDSEMKKQKDRFWKQSTDGQTRMVTREKALKLNKRFFSFSFVRNPFDRVISAYNNKIVENKIISTKMRTMNLNLGMSFEEFVQVLAKTPDDELDIHLLPQSSILKFENRIIPKFVGRLENIKEDWEILGKVMAAEGVPTLGKLPSKNVRRKDSDVITSYFESKEIIDLVHERYKDDIDTFYPEVSITDLIAKRGGIGMPPLVDRISSGC